MSVVPQKNPTPATTTTPASSPPTEAKYDDDDLFDDVPVLEDLPDSDDEQLYDGALFILMKYKLNLCWLAINFIHKIRQ